ncbi:hypothetical protein A2W32_05340 [candidate division WWE3 bacterium RBG_16_37_10]|uniref:Uncharacterized protein n=1 Tax=candidate division WWE3 bacterium RBG_16_37_10 TaxID=1802610 RepID=A0A1F4UXR8_UNCKA|nr:MAG: hypothetical protein A2W32_05340 [candidate division WWE3 bacterium RBG_16_37_10]
MKKIISPLRKTKLENRFHGFHRHFKNRFELIKSGVLTNSEYILWDLCYSALVDWDNRHLTYETFDFTNAEIATALSWDETTVSKNMASLIEKGFISRCDGRCKKVTNWDYTNYLLYQDEVKNIPIKILNHDISHEQNEKSPSKDENNIDIDEIIHEMDKDEYLKSLVDKGLTPNAIPP